MEKIIAKKSLGQHFLSSPAYLAAIADAAEIKKNDVVLEIGPGKGALTAELLSRGAKVIAVEKDHRLVPMLEHSFAKEIKSKHLKVIEADALEFAPEKYVTEGKFKLVANIPYYITGALFEKFLGHAPRPNTLVFLVQKEIAERIARSKKESILSLSVKVYGNPKYIKTVPRGAFSPAPTVDSAILAVYNVSAKNFANIGHEKWFFEILRAGFAHKRKLLLRNLDVVLEGRGVHALPNADISLKARSEDVPLEKWLALSNI
jgi:16S rRNA (adenine1518-N6/adenine1519-N6)-dimethyltransferase